jgi:hypothetical protein
MQIRSPDLTSEQIATWMRIAADRPVGQRTDGRAPVERLSSRHHPGFDFKQVRRALNHARKKTEVQAPKPFRRLRRNQGAVNEGLIDSLGALIAVNKQMASEIAALSTDVATLRQRLAENETQSTSLKQS